MALSTVSQPLPEMEHLLLTEQLICFFAFFLHIFYIAMGCFMASQTLDMVWG